MSMSEIIYSQDFIRHLSSMGIVRQNEILSNYTTYKTGGPADILIYPHGKSGISKIIKFSREESVPVTVIGGGSNLLISDHGIRGIVMRISDDNVVMGEIYSDDGEIYSDAVVQKKDFIDFSTNAGYEGMEFMAGIPGCIGGGIFMNAGCNLGTFVDILQRVDYIDCNGEVQNMNVAKDTASYRKFSIPESSIIIGGTFLLKKSSDKIIVKKRIEEILDDRKKKHPLSYPSAGSVFKNPEEYSSWQLIDQSGLKGKRIGGAQVSDLHTNFIVNVDNALSSDVLNLIDFIRDRVYSKFNVSLETEIKMLGDF